MQTWLLKRIFKTENKIEILRSILHTSNLLYQKFAMPVRKLRLLSRILFPNHHHATEGRSHAPSGVLFS